MANEIDQKVISQLLDFSRSVETLTETVEKSINSTDNLVGSQNRFGKKIDSFTEVINGPIQKINQSVSKTPSNNILGAFQEGGIAKDKGKYLVGENGPELVDLPKGSAVIPLNIKDLIEGISKIPELSDIAKENNIGIYADSEDPSLLTSEISDVKNRVSLSKLEEKYDLDLKDQESIDRDKQNKELIDQLKNQSDLLKELKSIYFLIYQASSISFVEVVAFAFSITFCTSSGASMSWIFCSSCLILSRISRSFLPAILSLKKDTYSYN